jgi:tetratricopeptide (TPR) repeat protein
MTGAEETASVIARWLALSGVAEMPLGFSRDKARSRARELRRLITQRAVLPNDLPTAEETKDVLWALSELIVEDPVTDIHQIEAVCRFVEAHAWPQDTLHERNEILRRCATEGWDLLGLPKTDSEIAAGSLEPIASLVAQLSGDTVASTELLEHASAGFYFANALDLAERQPSKRAALRCVIAFIAWRTARENGLAKVAYQWAQSFDRNLLAATPLRKEVTDRVLNRVPQFSPHDQPFKLFAAFAALREIRDRDPQAAGSAAELLFNAIASESKSGIRFWNHYFAGQAAFSRAGSARFLGDHTAAEEWVAIAEQEFQELINPAELLADTAYTRLTIAYERGNMAAVFAALPYVKGAFAAIGSTLGLAKCRIVEGSTLKLAGRIEEASRMMEELIREPGVEENVSVLGHALVCAMECRLVHGDYPGAFELLRRISELATRNDFPSMAAHGLAAYGEVLRQQDRLVEALESFLEARNQFDKIGFGSMAARVRLLIGETLLALGRRAEARAELLEALSMFDEQKMRPEGLVAAALVAECRVDLSIFDGRRGR